MSCNGTKKNGQPCTFKVSVDGFCKFHAKQNDSAPQHGGDDSAPQQGEDDGWEYYDVWVYEYDDGSVEYCNPEDGQGEGEQWVYTSSDDWLLMTPHAETLKKIKTHS